MTVPFFDLKRQLSSIKTELMQAIESTVDSGAFILGPKVVELEQFSANYIGTKYALGVASGTDALHLALKSLNIRPGDEVITSPFTFVATADAIEYCQAKPAFVDIDPKTFNLDPNKVEAKVTNKTKAILPVHLYGLPCDMDILRFIAKKHRLKIVEDCAQAIGSEYNQSKTGSLGDIGCFSFFPTKNLGCFGDGGLITTNDSAIADSLKSLRGHGSSTLYHYDKIGFNSRLDSIQASILLVRFKHLNDWTDLRRKNASIYNKFLSPIKEASLPTEPIGTKHVYNQYVIRVKGRDLLMDYLKSKGIGAMVYYPLSLHLQKAFAYLGHNLGDFPEAEKAQSEVLALPIFPELTQPEIEEVCSAIISFYGKN